MAIFEVFRTDDKGGVMTHVGSVEAPHLELAVQYAREVYSRRQEATKLWVAPRDAIAVVEDQDFLQPPLDRSFKMGVAYRVTVDKRKELRESAGKATSEAHS